MALKQKKNRMYWYIIDRLPLGDKRQKKSGFTFNDSKVYLYRCKICLKFVSPGNLLQSSDVSQIGNSVIFWPPKIQIDQNYQSGL